MAKKKHTSVVVICLRDRGAKYSNVSLGIDLRGAATNTVPDTESVRALVKKGIISILEAKKVVTEEATEE